MPFCPLNWKLIAVLIVSAPFSLFGQIYPTDTTTWCLFSTASPNFQFSTYSFIPGDDTLIDGRTYNVIRHSSSGPPIGGDPEFYVRNDSLGRGRMYRMSDGQEYLTADHTVQVGDTVHDVLVYNWVGTGGCSLGGELITIDVYVDSIAQFVLGNGQTVKRFYVSSSCYDTGFFLPTKFFWQEHAGTSMGAVMSITDALSSVQPDCFVSGGTISYSSTGFQCACSLNSVPEFIEIRNAVLQPNPVPPGHFVAHSMTLSELEIRSMTGQIVEHYNGSTQGFYAPSKPGIFFIRGRWKGHQVVERLFVN